MALTRTPHWATRELHDFIGERMNAPFAWGTNDCALFAADAIQSFTGTDIAADFRGKYADRETAFALIQSVTGGDSVEAAAEHCAQRHGLVEYPKPLFAQRGDLVVAKVASEDETSVAGIIGLHGQVLSVGEKGLIRLPVSSVTRAWKV